MAGAYAIDEVKDTCNPASKRGLLYAGFVDGAEWADAHPHWISIDDELPPKQPNREQSKNVLVRTNSGRTKIEYYDYGNDVIKEWWEYNITHWMPLPQAPSSSEFPNNCEKGEEDEDHFIDANKKVDRVIGTADHIKTALDVLNKKGGKE